MPTGLVCVFGGSEHYLPERPRSVEESRPDDAIIDWPLQEMITWGEPESFPVASHLLSARYLLIARPGCLMILARMRPRPGWCGTGSVQSEDNNKPMMRLARATMSPWVGLGFLGGGALGPRRSVRTVSTRERARLPGWGRQRTRERSAECSCRCIGMRRSRRPRPRRSLFGLSFGHS